MAAPCTMFTFGRWHDWRIVLLFFGSICHFIQVNCKPNIVIFLADDLGYGDLQIYGHPTSSTPNINRLAADGLQFTQFYSVSPVCSPSRAAFLTGRYPVRSGIYPETFLPSSTRGLPKNETTIAELLKSKGYSTNIIGKWHLGVGKDYEHLPKHHGFDSYFGVPYSHDMCPCSTCFYPNDHCWDDCDPTFTMCPVFANLTLIEQPVDLLTLDERYTCRAKSWIAEKAAEKAPFFLYLSFQHTHHAQYASKQFRNKTLRGTFGDSLNAIDWTVGEVINQLDASNILDNTFVFFTSDNGPSLRNQNRGGSAGLLKCGKGTTYEGGVRVPAIAYWPHHIKPGRTAELGSLMDLYPTIANLVGATMPNNVTIDGIDMAPTLFKGGKSQRESFFYYFTDPDPKIGVYAVRYKQYKAHFYTQGQINSDPENHDHDCRPTANLTQHDPPLLYDLHQDPSEQYKLNHTQYESILNTIIKLRNDFNANMEWMPSQITPTNVNAEPCCNKPCKPFPSCCHCEKKPGNDSHIWNKYSRKENDVL